MDIKIRYKTVSRLLFLVFVIIGCSHDPKVKEFPVSASPTEEMFMLNRDMQVAKDVQTEVLSPKNYEKAVDHQKDAADSLSKNKKPQVILKHIALSRYYLSKANHYTALSNDALTGVAEARQRAIDAGAMTYFDYEMTKADRKLKDLTADIERDESSDARRDAAETQVRYLDIELSALKKTYLDESEKLVKQAKKEGAQRNAPKSLAITETSLSDSAAFITGNRRDQEGMMRASQTTFNHAKLLLKITRDVKLGRNSTSEEMALRLNSEENKVVGLNQRMAQQMQESAQDQSRITTLTTEKKGLQSEQELEKSFEKARKRFKQNEASVYKRGDSLLIRLHGLKFSSSESKLTNSNLDLLNKVNLAIEDIGANKVQVNGHTDSVGGKELNQKVSQDRAEVIKNYLQAKTSNDELMIETKAYDFQQPIATNKTAIGRSYNRRVDIVIEPTQSSKE